MNTEKPATTSVTAPTTMSSDPSPAITPPKRPVGRPSKYTTEDERREANRKNQEKFRQRNRGYYSQYQKNWDDCILDCIEQQYAKLGHRIIFERSQFNVDILTALLKTLRPAVVQKSS